ncbi:MAG: HEAT repeat domain-containing protein [Chitinophagaceae bacterium]|nr:HEAT repeat domain-containing protein [Chitinophagaceae bacterium]
MLYLRVHFTVLIVALLCLGTKAQSVKIGIVDIYGNRSIPSGTIRQTAGVTDGDSVSQQSLAARKIERSLEKIPGVKLAQTAVICCDNNERYVLFVGIAETDSSVFTFRKSPTLKIKLPDAYTNAYEHFERRMNEAMLSGQATDDWSNGYSLIKYPPARRVQEKYLRWANADFDGLRKVLRSSAYDNQRAAAVQIIAYNDDKSKVVPELIYAIRDENDEVRNNAAKALSAITYYMTLNPGKIRLPFQPFVRMINSVVWSDRSKGLAMLVQLSESRNEELFRQLKATSMPSLKEMALWKSESHARPAFIILARMAGWADEKIRAVTTGQNFADEVKKFVDTIE